MESNCILNPKRMEIKRKIKMTVAANRRYTIRQVSRHENYSCGECDSAMLTAEQTADYFGINQRSIFRFIEEDEIHFFETEGKVVVICLTSLAKVLKVELSQNLIPD